MIATLLSVLLFSAPAADVVAGVDGEAISAVALKQRIEAERAAGMSRKPSEVVQTLIDEALLYGYGRDLGLASDPEVAAKVDGERYRLATELFLEKEIDATVSADEATLREAYHQGADSVRIKVIVVASRGGAEATLDRLRKGADFAAEAGRSLDPRGKASGGDLGWQSRAQLDPALAAAAFAAAPGALVGPVEMKLGFGVAQVLERHIGDEAGFSAKREALRRFVLEGERKMARRHYLDKARAAAKVALDEAFLRSTGTRVDASHDEEQHVLATVYRRKLTYGMILPELLRLSRGQQNPHFSGPAVKTEIANLAVDGILLEDAALKRGYAKAPSVIEKLREVERSAIAAAAARLARTAPAAGEADLEAYYAQHLADYKRPGRRVCAHILVSTEAEAKELRERALRGEPFDALARERSRDRETAGAGGALGAIDDDRLEAMSRRDAEPALAAALRKTSPGAVSAPVKSRGGWHLLRCAPHVPPGPAPFAEVKSAVGARVAADRAEAAFQRKLGELRAKARITIDRDAVARVASPAT